MPLAEGAAAPRHLWSSCFWVRFWVDLSTGPVVLLLVLITTCLLYVMILALARTLGGVILALARTCLKTILPLARGKLARSTAKCGKLAWAGGIGRSRMPLDGLCSVEAPTLPASPATSQERAVLTLQPRLRVKSRPVPAQERGKCAGPMDAGSRGPEAWCSSGPARPA